MEEAEQVRRELVTIQQQHLIALEDACVLEHGEDGHVHLKQAINLAAAGAASGSFWGMLIGLLFLNPLVGLAVGAGTGAASGALSDIGINDQFLKELGETLPKGSAALALLVRGEPPIVWWKVCEVTRPMPGWSRPASATLMRTNCVI